MISLFCRSISISFFWISLEVLLIRSSEFLFLYILGRIKAKWSGKVKVVDFAGIPSERSVRTLSQQNVDGTFSWRWYPNADETHDISTTRCQFHQHFTSIFFIENVQTHTHTHTHKKKKKETRRERDKIQQKITT